MQVNLLKSPIDSAFQNNQGAQVTSFDSFINEFKATLKKLFYDDDDINRFSIQRGLPPGVLQEIMSCNPLSVSIPLGYGGRGGVVHENLELLAAASYESLALSLTLGINSALFIQPVAKYGNDRVKSSVFNRFINFKNMGGLMITEPGFGSDALNMQTSFVERTDHYHIRGTKHWAGLTGQAHFWLLTARKQVENAGLQRDIEFFICDTSHPAQEIVVEEYFENLGLYQIPYGRNKIDVQIPKMQRLEPHTTGIQMMLDLLHRSRLQFPGMGLGFIKRMLDEAINHCKKRLVGGRLLTSYDQVQQHLARLQASYTICSALCTKSNELADLRNDLTPLGLEANILKSVTSDLMQDTSQTLMQLVGAIGYKLNHIAGRAIVDSRPFQIFEGSNDILYAQISESLIKLMKTSKEKSLLLMLKGNELTSRAADYLKELLSFDIDMQMPQRKLVELGRLMSRIVSMDLVIKMGENGFRTDLIDGAISMLRQEITNLISNYSYKQSTCMVEDYEVDSSWINFSGA